MTPPRKPLLIRVWRKLFPEKPKPVTLRANRGIKPPARPVGIEPLEGRIAPAAVLNASTISFTDLDGDSVTVTFSKPLFNFTGTALTETMEAVFEFGDSTGAHSDFGTANASQQLQQIDLTKVPLTGIVNPAAGVSITVTAARTASGGNDLANVGAIKADNLVLGSVKIAGDLGQIDCGSSGLAGGLKRLEVASLGKVPGTQTGTPDFESKIVGPLGALVVAGDVNGYVHAINGTGTSAKAVGKIGSVTIGGFLGSGGATRDNAGLIQSASDIGAVKIGDDVTGGAGKNSGAVISGGRIASLTLGGNLLGSTGEGSGAISAAASIGFIKSMGGITGGDGSGSGVVKAGGALGAVTFGDSLVAGKGLGSGVISSVAAMGAVKISGDIDARLAGVGAQAGGISAGAGLPGVTVEGSIFGGGATTSGFIQAVGAIGPVKVAGSVVGGTGQNSGTVSSGNAIASVLVSGELDGGGGLNSGSIFSGFAGDGGIGTVRISLGAKGGDGDNSGAIVSGGRLGSVVIGSASDLDLGLVGGVGDFSGAIYARGAIGSAKLFHDLQGGSGASSGTITAHGKLGAVTVDGAIFGNQGAGSGAVVALDDTAGNRVIAGEIGRLSAAGLHGGNGTGAGMISSAGRIASVTLGGFYAGTGSGSGKVISGTGLLAEGNIGQVSVSLFGRSDVAGVVPGGTLEVHGSLFSLATSGPVIGGKVAVAGNIGSMRVGGDLVDSTITAAGGSRGASIGQLAIRGDVEGSDILAGYSVTGTPVNADATIGAVIVSGDWEATNLVAGIRDAAGDGFGDSGDVVISAGTDNPLLFSRIVSVTIGGVVAGGGIAGERFGFVAQQIGAFTHGGEKLAFAPQTAGQFFDLTSQVAVREVTPSAGVA